MKRNKLFYLLSLIVLVGFSSCVDDPPFEAPVVKGKYETGYFITNEGAFNDGTGTVSFVDGDGVLSNYLFQVENDDVLGNILQSMTIIDTSAYFVLNNAKKIEVTSRNSMKSTGVIDSLNQPRYMVAVGNDKAYVSEWGSGSNSVIAVVDLLSNSVIEEIDLGQSGAEHMLVNDGKAYVANSGGFSNDSTISIIDISTSTFSNVVIGDNPVDIVKDKNNAIWVITKGVSDYTNPENNTDGGLFKLENDVVTASFVVPRSYKVQLEINKAGDKLFYLSNGKIFSQHIDTTLLSLEPFLSLPDLGSFYGIAINPENDHIFGTDAGDYKSNGTVHEYDVQGNEVMSIETGVIPNGVYF